MRAKTILTVLFLISVGVAGFVFLRALPQNVDAANAPPPEEVLVAKVPLAPGTLLRTEDLAWQPVAAARLGDEILRPAPGVRQGKPELDQQARAAVYGAALRIALAPGEPIRPSILVKPGDRDFLRIVLTPRQRAISIPVTTGGSSTGLLTPGDRVDVILTQAFKDQGAPLALRSVSETIVQDLRVLAIDAPDAKTAGNLGPSVTLEVTPERAESINVATELGKLSLTLRPAGDTPSAAAAGRDIAVKPTWAGDVSPALGAVRPAVKPVAAEQPPIQIVRGATREEVKTR
jgi:pilus assembly protein CpaB